MTTAARPESTQVARWFHALSDETRVQIVEMLSHKARCVCELEQVLGVAQSRLSFHLKVLKDAGLLADRRDGRWMYYALNPDVIEEIDGFVSSLKLQSRRSNSKKCCD